MFVNNFNLQKYFYHLNVIVCCTRKDLTMSIKAYINTLAPVEELSCQKSEILAYTNKHGLKLDVILDLGDHSTKVSSKKRLDDLMSLLDQGDTLIVSDLAYLGGSMGEMACFISAVLERHIDLIAVRQGINTFKNANMASKSILTLAPILSELQQSFKRQRTRIGVELARAQGKKIGRPKGSLGKSKLDQKVPEIQHLLSLRVPQASIAKIVGISRQGLIYYLKTRMILKSLKETTTPSSDVLRRNGTTTPHLRR